MTTAYNIQKCRAKKNYVEFKQVGMKFISVIVLAVGFFLASTITSFADEQPQAPKDASSTQLTPVNALTKPAEEAQESNNAQVPVKGTEDTSWQSIKIDKTSENNTPANSSCPCDSTGVRSRLMRMGGIENSSPGYGGRGMGSGGMGRGRR